MSSPATKYNSVVPWEPALEGVVDVLGAVAGELRLQQTQLLALLPGTHPPNYPVLYSKCIFLNWKEKMFNSKVHIQKYGRDDANDVHKSYKNFNFVHFFVVFNYFKRTLLLLLGKPQKKNLLLISGSFLLIVFF